MIEVRQRLPPLKKVSFRQDSFSLKGKGEGLAERRSRVRSSRNTLRRSLVLLLGSAAILAVGLVSKTYISYLFSLFLVELMMRPLHFYLTGSYRTIFEINFRNTI